MLPYAYKMSVASSRRMSVTRRCIQDRLPHTAARHASAVSLQHRQLLCMIIEFPKVK